ncbi:MAG: helix-turn-helix domain-containing protein [Candidatus Berkelbacteria bacterium]|nr:helix-turn-helix domain-containing protein [Candidatus Berkelbacteria bacterium]
MVAAGFNLRKIRTSQTFGEKLRRARKRLQVDLIEAELSTKVRAKYIEALEREDFELLPSDIYVRGFLATYSQYLGLDAEKTWEEYQLEKRGRKDLPDETFSTKKIATGKTFIVTPKIATIFFSCLFCAAAAVYVVLQVLSFSSVPKLSIISPANDSVVEVENITISGKTDTGASIKINQESVSVDSSGNFQRDVSLQNGINTIVVSAENKANKIAEETVIVEKKVKTAENKP